MATGHLKGTLKNQLSRSTEQLGEMAIFQDTLNSMFLYFYKSSCSGEIMKLFSLFVALFFCCTFGLSVLPSVGMAAQAQSSLSSMNKISINSADEVTLTQIPGVGTKTATAIVNYRKEIGTFKDLDQLMGVKGIGAKKLEKMKPYITL